MRCLTCDAELEIADRQGVEVFCCPWCAGIWLNAGDLEKIVTRILDANTELEAGSQTVGKAVRAGSGRASPFPDRTKRRSLKMRTTSVLILAVFGLLMVATAYGDEPKSYRVALSNATIGTAALSTGEYQMLVHRDGEEPKVRLTEVRTGNVIEVAAKVEGMDKKFERTEVVSQSVNGAKQISEIRIGGTKLRVVFQQGSSL